MAMSRWSGNSTTTAWPESAHSFNVVRRSASSRLSGMVLMPMKLLSSHDQFVADLPPHDEQNDFRSLDIIQDAEVAGAQLKLSKGVGTQLLDGLRQRRRLMKQPCLDCRFEEALLAGRQRPQLRFGIG